MSAQIPSEPVPSGIDAQTWRGFEERIRERRFQVLLEIVDHAVAGGNRAAAYEALEGLRELRPGSRELDAAEERLTRLEFQGDPEITAAPGFLWSRVFSAISLLLVGVSLLVGLDWLRMAPPLPAPPPAAVLLPGLDRLHLPPVDVAAASPQPRRHAAAAAARAQRLSNRVAAARKAPPPSGWGKVLKPTARFFTTTLPRVLGVQTVRDPASAPPRGRSAI